MRPMALIPSLFFVACASSASPGAPAADGVPATCDKPHIAQCTDYLQPIDDAAARLCESTKGVLTRGGAACKTDALVGTCTSKNPAGIPLRIRSYDGARDPAGVCGMVGGTWEAAH